VSLTEHVAQWRLRLGGAKARASVALVIAVAAAALSAWQLHYSRKYLRGIAATVEAQSAQQTTALHDLQKALAEQGARLDHIAFAQQGIAIPEGTGAVAQVRLGCLTDDLVARVKTDAANVVEAFARCGGELRSVIGAALGTLDEPDYFAIFATLVSFRWAPYGPGGGITMDILRNQTVMQCSQYAALTGQLFRYAPGQDGTLIRVVGVDGGAVLNHAQLYYSRGQTNLLLDPTIGVIAVASFDDVLRGIPVAPTHILDFYDRTEIAGFRTRVVKALTQGLYRPSDLLYYFEGIDAYMASNATSDDFLTPGGVRLRARAAADK
jgi:hypothetical protein